MTADLNALVALPRFTFIAEFLVAATRRKADRDLVSGYQVRKAGSRYRVLATHVTGSPIIFETESAATLFDHVRRGPLGYLTRQADDLRSDAAVAA